MLENVKKEEDKVCNRFFKKSVRICIEDKREEMKRLIKSSFADIIKDLESQRDRLLKENESNFVEFGEQLKKKFVGSLEFTEEIRLWKQEVQELTKNYDGNKKKLKNAFLLINSENDRNLLTVGKQFKDNIEHVIYQTEELMEKYLSEYKLEKRYPADKPMMTIYNPKLDLESTIFNIDINNEKETKEINAVRRYSSISNQKKKEEAQTKKKSKIKHLQLLDINNIQRDRSRSRSKSPYQNKEVNCTDIDLLTEISLVEIPELKESRINKTDTGNGRVYYKPYNTTQTNLMTPQYTNFMRSFEFKRDTSFMKSQKNLPDFRRNLSPVSGRNILMSPIRKNRQGPVQTLLYTGKLGKDKSKERRKSSIGKQRETSKNKSISNIKEKSVKRRGSNVSDAAKAKTLRKMLSGRHSEIVQDLKRGGLINFDLTFAGELIRP